MNSLEESLDDRTGTLPGIPPVNVSAALRAIQQNLAPVSRETRLLSLAILAHAIQDADPGLGAEATADEAAHYLAALERHT